jgi:hypothetical protein
MGIMPIHSRFVEVSYEVRRIFVVIGAPTDDDALDRVLEAHRSGSRVMRPALGAETGVYIGAGISHEAKMSQCIISERASYRGIPTSESW